MQKNKIIRIVLVIFMVVALIICTEKTGSSTPSVKECSIIHEPEFGGVYIQKTIDEFNLLGFSYGDSVDVVFSNGYALKDLPYYNGYYTQSGDSLLVAYPGYDYIKVAIHFGDDLWNVAGLSEDMTVNITLNKKGRYKDIQDARDIRYEDERSLYASDEVFANYRSVSAGDIKENILYRSASPCDNQHGRATYTDRLMSRDGIKIVLDLADNDEKIETYMSEEDFACPYFQSLYIDGNVEPIALNANFGSDEYRQKLSDGFTRMVQHDGPYLIHCTEGKDRTGFACMLLEALLGASWEEIETDYMLTYANYYGITKETDPKRYDAILKNVLIPMVEGMVGEENIEVRTEDLKPYAERLLINAGMSKETMEKLIERIGR